MGTEGPGKPDDGLEIELKLAADPKDLDRLRRSELIRSRIDGRIRTQNLATTYYDTLDRRLSRQDLALRVRKNGRRYSLSVKGGTVEPGVSRRSEYEVAIPDERPDLERISDAGAREAIGLIMPGELVPVFTSRIRRRVAVLNGADASGGACKIELAFDDGALVSGEREDALAELELELLEGAPVALYDLAIALAATAPLRIEVRSKAVRGFLLADAAALPIRKARSPELDPDMTVEDALAMIVRACLGHALTNQPAALAGVDPEGVHQMRVGLRRLRSALALFKAMIPPSQLDWLKAESKWFAGTLGDARDWDVFLGELLAPAEALLPSEGSPALRAAGEAARERGYERVRAAMADPRSTAFVLGLGAWVEGRRWREAADPEQMALARSPVRLLAERLLEKRQATVRKRGRRFARLSPEKRHELRIALKKLRYASEFFGSLFDADAYKRHRKRMSRLQDDLGALNDVAVARDRVTGLDVVKSDPATARAAGELLGWHAKSAADKAAHMTADWKAFKAARPFWA